MGCSTAAVHNMEMLNSDVVVTLLSVHHIGLEQTSRMWKVCVCVCVRVKHRPCVPPPPQGPAAAAANPTQCTVKHHKRIGDFAWMQVETCRMKARISALCPEIEFQKEKFDPRSPFRRTGDQSFRQMWIVFMLRKFYL